MDIFIAIITGAATAAVTWKLFFKDMENFLECLRFWLTPDAWSFFKGEYWDDCWAELKLGLWILVSFSAGYGALQFLQ